MKLKPADKSNIIEIFKRIDKNLTEKSKNIRIIILGGASILLLGLRERVTADIDIAVSPDADNFRNICLKLGVPVDIITVASTVDLGNCPTLTVFNGKNLTVDSVTPKDLIKLKLERFYKQDPEDIYAIIKHESLDFNEFKDMVVDMIPDYIGDARRLILSAQIVVEQIYPHNIDQFKSAMARFSR